MMTPGSRHTTAKSTQRLLLARRVNFLVCQNLAVEEWDKIVTSLAKEGYVFGKICLCVNNITQKVKYGLQ